METTEHPRKKLIIKIYFPWQREQRYCTARWVNVENPSESSVADSQISRTKSEVCDLNKKKEGIVRAEGNKRDKKRKLVYSPRSEKPEATSDEKRRKVSSSNLLSRTTGSKEECSRLKNKEDNVHVECKNKRKAVQEHVMVMDRCKKMQCWAMLKRLMVGKDAWAIKRDILDPKILCVLDKYEAMRKPKGLEDIESKLKNWGYSEADEFVDDVRLVLSYALQYPPRSEVHRTATRISEGFEISWKTTKEKWMSEEREGKMICKREHHVN